MWKQLQKCWKGHMYHKTTFTSFLVNFCRKKIMHARERNFAHVRRIVSQSDCILNSGQSRGSGLRN